MGNVVLIYSLEILLAISFLLFGAKWRGVYLAVLMPTFILPGSLKLFDAHFVTDISANCKHMCDLSPIETAFYFFSYSRIFIRTVGLIQLLSGILLIFKKFRFLGLLMCLVISCHINLINISFWGMSAATLYMLTISIAVIIYLAKDYSEKLKSFIGN